MTKKIEVITSSLYKIDLEMEEKEMTVNLQEKTNKQGK